MFLVGLLCDSSVSVGGWYYYLCLTAEDTEGSHCDSRAPGSVLKPYARLSSSGQSGEWTWGKPDSAGELESQRQEGERGLGWGSPARLTEAETEAVGGQG